jgi:protein SCO1
MRDAGFQQATSLIKKRAAVVLAMTMVTAACSRGKTYELGGQVLAVDAARQELTVKHDDIRGFMPAMTMPFRVRNAQSLDGRVAGDLIRATLVVEDTTAYLSTVESIGHAPVAIPLSANEPARFDLLDAGDEVPDFLLVDQAGASRRLSEFRGRVVAVTFIYTRCPLPDFCQQMDRRFAVVEQEAAADDRLRFQFHLLSVSIDPAFDSPGVLQAHAQRVGANPATWSFATGEPSEIQRLASRFGISILRRDPSAQDIVHNLRTAVIDRDGRLKRVFGSSDWQAADLLAEMRSSNGSR